MKTVLLSESQRRRLVEAARASRDKKQRRRSKALLAIADGQRVSHVAASLGISRQWIYEWMKQFYAESGARTMKKKRKRGRPRLWSAKSDKALRECMGTRPEDWGYRSGEWTKPLLQQWLLEHKGLTVSRTWVMKRLYVLGYEWKGKWIVCDKCSSAGGSCIEHRRER